MAADETKQPGKQRVVEMVKASRTWRGAYQADYNCPKCRSPLVSLDDTLLATETCPNCSAAFIFGSAVQTEYRTHKATIERKEAEKQRVAEQRRQLAEEKEKAAEAERQRFAEIERSQVKRKIAENKAIHRERNQKISARRGNLNGVEMGIGTVSVLSFIGSLIMVVVGISGLTSDNEVAGMTLLLAGVVSLVSLLLVWGLFRCLFAIHQLLTDISGKLDEARPKT
jgi:uncharacterized Zn finger protein (UPF0148 family)